MSATNDGGPAFPVHSDIYHGSGLCGMSLRDWFAGNDDLSDIPGDFAESCMSALAGRPIPLPPATQVLTPSDWIAVEQWNADWRAKLKYIRADAMLRARERGQEGGAQ